MRCPHLDYVSGDLTINPREFITNSCAHLPGSLTASISGSGHRNGAAVIETTRCYTPDTVKRALTLLPLTKPSYHILLKTHVSVQEYKSTRLTCVPSTFGKSALTKPYHRERRFVTMNTASGFSMRKCLKAWESACRTRQHKPQFCNACNGLSISRLRLRTLRVST